MKTECRESLAPERVMPAATAPMSDHPIPWKVNLTVTAVHLGLFAYLYWLFPLFVLAQGLWSALTLLPIGLASNAWWSVLHESLHGRLLPTKRHNDALGRILAAGFGGSFLLLRTSHLLHHRHNRSEVDRLEVYDPERTGRPGAWLVWLVSLLGGLYVLEL